MNLKIAWKIIGTCLDIVLLDCGHRVEVVADVWSSTMWKNCFVRKTRKRRVVRHCNPTKVDSNHNRNVRAKTVSSQIPFVTDSFIQDKNVMKAKILHTEFIVQHNISINTAEHLNKLYSKMFPDSKIVKNFHCSRTKTTCILNNALAPELTS